MAEIVESYLRKKQASLQMQGAHKRGEAAKQSGARPEGREKKGADRSGLMNRTK